MRQGWGRLDKREAPQRGARGASLGSVGRTVTGEGIPRQHLGLYGPRLTTAQQKLSFFGRFVKDGWQAL